MQKIYFLYQKSPYEKEDEKKMKNQSLLQSNAQIVWPKKIFLQIVCLPNETKRVELNRRNKKPIDGLFGP